MNKFSKVIEEFIRKKDADICIPTWLDSVSKNAFRISAATHVLKFSHGNAKGTSISVKICELNERDRTHYITTGSLNKGKIDFVGDAKFLIGVASFLQLEIYGATLLDRIAAEDFSSLAPFADSEARLLRWIEGFRSVLVDRKLSSHTLAKQIYFPIGENKYHLLSPLYASSLSQALYEKINADRDGEKAKTIRQLKDNKINSAGVVVDYPKLAYQRFGGMDFIRQSNISMLNSSRRGKSFLLKNLPPEKKVGGPPLGVDSFWNEYKNKVLQKLKEFKKFISKNKKYRSNDFYYNRRLFIHDLLDDLLSFSKYIQTIKPGWSLESKLKPDEKVWLDPYLEEHQELYKSEDWIDFIAGKFADLVFRFLFHKNIGVDDEDLLFFKNECFNQLKRFK